MARRRRPEREQARELYMDSGGHMALAEIGRRLCIPANRIRKWKSLDKWEEELHRREAERSRKKRGGQPGNQNAKGNRGGHGAPAGNTNAETHGAYSIPRMEVWSEAERAEVENLPCEFSPVAERQLKKLWAKQHDIERRIAALDRDEEGTLYLDRTMTMTLPGNQRMEYTFQSSRHSRRMALEGELNRVQGRINKLLDSIRGREQEEKRLEFDREKFAFERQRITGVFDAPEERADSEEDAEIVE